MFLYTRLESILSPFGPAVGHGKCLNLTANQKQSSVRFWGAGPAKSALVPRKRSATYFGTLLTYTFGNRAEISNGLGDCIATCNRVKLFWRKANTRRQEDDSSIPCRCQVQTLIWSVMHSTHGRGAIQIKCFSEQINLQDFTHPFYLHWQAASQRTIV